VRISKIKINNFANFSEFEIETGDNLVVVGENKVGKSNLIFALQLILDPGLSERDRQLGLEHFWDGLGDHKLGAVIEIVIELTDFEDDPRLLAHLGDCIVDAGPPMVSRLTYRFQPKADLDGEPQSMADYEYILFGGLDPTMPCAQACGACCRSMFSPLCAMRRKTWRHGGTLRCAR
jgi:putative ATP-dependent endonuclease of OLD family